MSKKYHVLVLVAALSAAGLTGCATQVKRVGVEEVKDLSGAWNDTDSRLVSEEMIRDSLSGGWLKRHLKNSKNEPVVIVGSIRNLSHEHINTRTFVNDLERAFVNSGDVRVVASKNEREGLRGERLDMDTNVREETRKAMGQETGADYMLMGSINTIIDAAGREQVRFYQVDLTLVSLANNEKVWTGQKKLKKEVQNAKLRF
ncbi:MAG: penicillin-binding protein activator LpoB [Hydrogenophilales bacterium 28-61-23]|nr:MAG: penicillin-binding protein activator LpoB [Hydrogenophilales bacterium 28-61-23]